jgi:hypothetical protein
MCERTHRDARQKRTERGRTGTEVWDKGAAPVYEMQMDPKIREPA